MTFCISHQLNKASPLFTINPFQKAVIELSTRLRVTLASLLPLIMLIGLSRCVLPTRVITSADPPEVVLTEFISALKQKNYEKADQFLADGASVTPVNTTGESFFDCFIDISLRELSCEPLEQAQINGTDAFISKVRIATVNKSSFVSWVQNNLTRLEHDYMVKNHLNEFDSSDRKAVCDMLSMAMNEYVKTAGIRISVIRVNFVYYDQQWKIVGNDDLISSIFGGV